MLKEIAICLLASSNIMVYSFIGLNYEAFLKMARFDQEAYHHLPMDQLLVEVQQALGSAPLLPRALVSQVRVLPTTAHHELPKVNRDIPAGVLGFLIVPKISLVTPIFVEEGVSVAEAQEKLEEGVLSLSELLDLHEEGRNIVFGHSSDYPWNTNPYATIFTLLPKLRNGDEIKVVLRESIREYRVQRSEVSDSQLASLSPPQGNELVLSTCWPIGFFEKRYNVIATPTPGSHTPMVVESVPVSSPS